MRFMRLTLWGAFDRLQHERERFSAGFATRALPWSRWLVVGLAGCASIGVDSPPEAKQKVVAERAEARWQLLIKGDVAGAYDFMSAGSKAVTSLDMYKAKVRPGGWRQASVEKVDCAAEVCRVVMKITYDRKQMKGIETPLDETWIIEKGSAWYVYR